MRAVAAALFELVVRLRNAAYDHALVPIHRIGVPVISVGNITMGGAGKTPLVAHLAGMLHDADLRVAVVTRGYGRTTRGTVVVSDAAGTCLTAREGGDEPVQLARALPWLPIVADEVRARGCRHAVARFAPDVILLDDAFQHRAVARDLDIVAIDAARAATDLRMAPVGRLREPLAHLARASLIVLTRCDDAATADALEHRLAACTDAPIVRTRFAVAALRDARTREVVDGGEGAVLAFCGIGSPASFRTTLAEASCDVADLRVFADHQVYREGDIAALHARAQELGVGTLVTTEKDVARIGVMPEAWGDLRVVYPEMTTVLLTGAEVLCSRVLEVARGSMA
jgi:tetraacyldisaccharide 4'-kinase